MCIFAQPVVKVSDTQIFARLLGDGWQALVYQMQFESLKDNAMILPLPVELPSSENESIEFISLKEQPRFFQEIARGYPLALPKSRSGSRGAVDAVDSERPQLKVQEVGDFIASFVPSTADFDRLDKQFRIPQESWDKIPQYSDFGFAVFQLKSKSGKPHPMAFKFRSRLSDQHAGTTFFPTVHIHDGEVHRREEFDHTLYLQAESFDDACGDYDQRGYLVTDEATGYVRSKWPAEQFCNIEASKGIIQGHQLIHRLEMKGKLKNADVLARGDLKPGDLTTVGKQSSIGPGLAVPVVAGLAGVAGLGWLFRRRHLLSAEASIETPKDLG